MKAWQDLTQYQDIGVVGIGQTGLSCVSFLLAQGIQPMLFDSRAELPEEAAIQQLEQQYQCQLTRHLGEFDASSMLAMDMLLVSPGVDLRNRTIQMARDAGVVLRGDIDLFAAQVTQPLLTITGSNGKSTVTQLTASLLTAAGKKVAIGGNIGIPVLDLLEQKDADVIDVYVLELSSFQLELMEFVQPHTATILNFSDDHLDRYANRREYELAKHRIYNRAEAAVWNRDQISTQPMVPIAKQITFGSSASQPQGRDLFGLQLDQPVAIERAGELLLRAQELQLAGLHNLLNVEAALALVESLGIDISSPAILDAAREFKGLAHRCQLVADENGVRWINDSKATNIGAAEAAISGLRPLVPGRLILIAGGDGKGADFNQFKPALAEVDELITLGRDGNRIGQVFTKPQHHHCVRDLAAAVSKAATLADSGSLVLLAPACASFDMFVNYQDRGQQFQQAVEAHYGAH